MDFSISLASMSDAPDIMEIIDEAKVFLREQGLPQWQYGYPNMEVIQADIVAHQSYVCTGDDGILGTFSLCLGNDPTYAKIYDGTWLSSLPYAVVHRVAVRSSYRSQGTASFMLQQVSSLVPTEFHSLRIDTHRNNVPMQKSLLKNGFTKCGIIYLTEDKKEIDERFAFEKLL